MRSFSEKEVKSLKNQYADSKNLDARISLHLKCSTNKYGWSKWVFDQFAFDSGDRVLELGCGSAVLWKDNIHRLPTNVSVVLSDFSSGMLNDAKVNLKSSLDFFEFEELDAQKIPYPDKSFDVVIANHMLYHLPNRKQAIREIYRCLKDDGIFYATTLGERNMSELIELVSKYDTKIDYPANLVAYEFGLQNGRKQVEECFKHVEMRSYDDSLEVTDVDILVDYVLSFTGLGNVTDIIKDSKVSDFRDYVQDIIKRDGKILITKELGMFIARKV